MRCVLPLILALIFCVGAGAADYPHQAPCAAPPPVPACGRPCGQPGCPSCACEAPCQQHVYVKIPPRGEYFPEEEAAPRQEAGPPAGGAFVAPPRYGRMAEESATIGLNGLRIRFPEFSIGLPSIELPSITRFHSGQRMHLESAVAPYVADRRVSYGGPAVRPQPESVPRPREEAAPRAPSCSTSEEAAQLRSQYEQKLEDLLEAERCLQERMRELEQCLEHLQRLPAPQSAPRIPTPPPQVFQPTSAQMPTSLPPVSREEFPVYQSTYVQPSWPVLPDIRRLPPAGYSDR